VTSSASTVSRGRSRKRRNRSTTNAQQSASGGSVRGIIGCVLVVAALCLVLYTHFSHRRYNHVVKTMHLRKSAFRSGGIESPQQDDLVPEDSIYNLMYPSMKHGGELVPLANFAGRVAIVINIASDLGNTDPTYSHIQDMLKKYSSKQYDDDEGGSGHYHDRNLVILAFPTNDFHREKSGNEEIEIKVKELLGEEYDNPNFMLFHKSKLEHNPVYKALGNHMPDHEVNQNFCKYLIGKDGVPVAFYTEKETLFNMENAILDELETDSSVGKNLRLRDGDANFFESKHV
jgi:glutathione peroxidase